MKAEAISIEREPVSEAPDCKALFTGFMQLGLMGFGGVLPLAHRIIVEDKKWGGVSKSMLKQSRLNFDKIEKCE